MRASINNYMDALKKQREERGEDGGFSLIELIIVVVILGILAAIAIPIFLNISAQAQTNALKATAATAATQVSAAVAKTNTVPASPITNLSKDGVSVTFTITGTDIDTICATATKASESQKSGPGCP